MPTPSNNAVATSVNGTLLPTVVTIGPNDHEARIVVDGASPTGVTGTIDVSVDGTTWYNLKAVQEDTSAPVSGTISPGGSKLSYWTRVTGWNYVRWNSTAVSSGTSVVTVYSAPSLGGEPITVTSDSTTSFTSGTFSGTLGVTGASTFTSGSFSTTLGVTGALTTGAAIVPAVNDVGAIGDATHGYADLFLASGAVINVANGNAVITHSSGIFTVSTGDLRVTTAGTNAASVVTVGGTQTLAAKTFTAPVIGVATGTSLAVTGLLTSSSASAGIGYATGAGGTVTQATDITTAVTLNKTCGTITTVSSTLAAGVDASFTLTNSAIAATDVVVASIKSYGGTSDGIPVVSVVATAAGSCVLNIRNTGAVTLDAVVVISFAVLKAVAA